ncbi:MAG: LemA family protein [Bacteroidetes bacterium]|nr:LemA family protein [Bacteroidota bacterium]
MQRKRYTGYIAGGVLVLLGLWVMTTYNGLVKKEEAVKKQWAEVQSTYQRRLDLLPNLVNVVKGVSDFEQTTLLNITEARSKALNGLSNTDPSAENIKEQQRQQDAVAVAANRLIIQIEKYPTLKGTDAYAGLQTQLEGTERRIRVARKDFNEAVAVYNKKTRSFPANIIAGLFGFKSKEGFQADAGAEKAVEINFGK